MPRPGTPEPPRTVGPLGLQLCLEGPVGNGGTAWVAVGTDDAGS